MNQKAYYGEFGGQYVAESLMNTLEELDKAFEEAIHDPEFMEQYHYYLKQYVGRETPLYFAERLSEKYGTKIYLKREDLNHTGAHKINNVIGQILLAKRMGKKKVIAETGAGQHGVATATGAALFDMECTVYMGEEDIRRQALNVMRMEMLGAKVVSVRSGSNTLKDATNEAIRTWAKTAEDTFYIIGSAVGPYPYPKMVREFQSVISREAKKQFLEVEHKLPDAVMACVGGGSNSIGMVDSTNSLNRKIPCGTLIATSTRMTAHAVFISPILFTILNRLTIFIWNGTTRPARNSRKMRFPHLDFVLASA